MNRDRLLDKLNFFFPCALFAKEEFASNLDCERIISRLLDMDKNPINYIHLNQLLHLVHQAGVTKGFFKYYFLTVPKNHPYPVDKVTETLPPLDERHGIASLEQLEWGLTRFHIDALLFFGNIHSAYREFRVKNYKEIKSFFKSKRIPTHLIASRGEALPFCKIPKNDRYLICELLGRAYPFYGEQLLMEAYSKAGEGNVRVTLFATKIVCLHVKIH